MGNIDQAHTPNEWMIECKMEKKERGPDVLMSKADAFLGPLTITFRENTGTLHSQWSEEAVKMIGNISDIAAYLSIPQSDLFLTSAFLQLYMAEV